MLEVESYPEAPPSAPITYFGRSESSHKMISAKTTNTKEHNLKPSTKLGNSFAKTKKNSIGNENSTLMRVNNVNKLPGRTSQIPKSRSLNALNTFDTFPSFEVKRTPGILQMTMHEAILDELCNAATVEIVGAQFSALNLKAKQTSAKRILNHLYDPVYSKVSNHLRKMPKKYVLSVTPSEIAMHVRLLAEARRSPHSLALHISFATKNVLASCKDSDISLIEVVIVAQDTKSLLDAITRSLVAHGSIVEADVMTTENGWALDTFVVKMDPKHCAEGSTSLPNIKLTEATDYIDPDGLKASITSSLSSVKALSLVTKKVKQQHVYDDALKYSESDKAIYNVEKPETFLDIDYDEIQLGNTIGEGRSGTMRSAKWQGHTVAAKVLNLSTRSDDDASAIIAEFYRELAVIQNLKHPNIVSCLGASSRAPHYITLFEMVEGGTLTKLLSKRKQTYDFFSIACEIADAMSYIHSNHILHRDLKPDNILITKTFNVKVIDFGLSCFVGTGGDRSGHELTAETGTYRWMAPEVIRHASYSFPADVYSYGVVLWQLLTRSQPFQGMTPIQAAFAVAKHSHRYVFFCIDKNSLIFLDPNFLHIHLYV